MSTIYFNIRYSFLFFRASTLVLVISGLFLNAGIISCTKKNENSAPNADFDFSTSFGRLPVSISFHNTSTNASSYNWDFGNGTSSTELNPTATYSAYRIYNVTLTAKEKGKSSTQTKQVIIIPNLPEVTVTSTPMSIFLPNNCAPTFIIRSTGPSGTLLSYTVRNSTLTPDYLVFTNPSGVIPSGGSVTIAVSVEPSHINTPFLIGSTVDLEVYTPMAFNGIQTYLSVNIRNMADQALNLLGIWGGNWTGNSFGASNPGQPSPTNPVNGTWSLNVQTVSPSTNTASGTVTWTGTDYYWTYTFDAFGNIASATPQPFNATQTFAFNNSNTSFITPAPATGCDRFRLIINDFLGSSYGIYGPRLVFDMNLRTNTVTGGASAFTAWPYTPVYVNNLSVSQSNGGLSGQKQ